MDVNIIVVGIISGVSLILGIKNWSKNKEITKDCILLKNEIHTLKEDVKRLEKSKNYNEEGDDIEEDEITHSLTYFRIAENWYGEGMIIKVNFKVGDYQAKSLSFELASDREICRSR